MSAEEATLLKHASEYAASRGIQITERLGWGIHGSVWKVVGMEPGLAWVLKLHRHLTPWRRERDCYRRLVETGTVAIAGINLPRMLQEDEEWLAIEMTLVKRPFLLDLR
jgi:hypothetical protein